MKILLRIGSIICALLSFLSIYAFITKYGEVPAHLVWDSPEVKTSIMSAGYKIYGNPKVENGHFYLSKIQFKNTGEHSITDFQISYKVDDYTTDWSEPDLRKEIPAGYSFNALYYPRFQDKINKLRNTINTTFRARVRWKEEGKQREENFTKDISILAMNILLSSDLPEKERITFQDYHNSAAFAVSMVTPNDPVVTAYTSQITKLSGGSTAGIKGGAKELYNVCNHIYDYMLMTQLRYVGDSFSTNKYNDVESGAQTVRLPRDVIIDNQGLCLELSLLWASILEHIGIRCVLIYIPGHAFVVAYAPNDGVPVEQGLAIETTAITPKAVNETQTVSFDKAVSMAQEELKNAYNDGRILPIDVHSVQDSGFTPPELPDVDIAKLTETLSQRLPKASIDTVNTNIKEELSNNFQNTLPYNTPSNPSKNKENFVFPNVDSKNNHDMVSYVSPDNSFSISHYKDWNIQFFNNYAIKLTNGSMYIYIQPMTAYFNGAQILEATINIIATSHRNLVSLDRGQTFVPSNRTAYYSNFTGIDQYNNLRHLTVFGIDGMGSYGYSVTASVSNNEYDKYRQDIAEMLNTLTIK